MKSTNIYWHDVAKITIVQCEPMKHADKLFELVRVQFHGEKGEMHEISVFGLADKTLKIEHHQHVDQPIDAL